MVHQSRPRGAAIERVRKRDEEQERRNREERDRRRREREERGEISVATPQQDLIRKGFRAGGETRIVDGKPVRFPVPVSERDFERLKGAVIRPTEQEQREAKAKQLEEGTAERRVAEEERRIATGEEIPEIERQGLGLRETLATTLGFGQESQIPGAEASELAAGAVFAGGRSAGQLIKQVPKKFTLTESRKRLKSLGNGKDGFKIFGLTLSIRDMIFGAAIYSQRRVGNLVSDINTQATTMGTEKNEKVAREMISGLDPDTAIRIYEGDIEVLRDSEQTLQFLKIFFIADYIGLKVENTQLNIRNQIDGKLSRIAESERFKLGLNIQDIQANLNAEEDVNKNEV